MKDRDHGAGELSELGIKGLRAMIAELIANGLDDVEIRGKLEDEGITGTDLIAVIRALMAGKS